MKRFLICGGRYWPHTQEVYRWMANHMYAIFEQEGCMGEYLPEAEIISGGARGIDFHAEELAVVNWLPLKVFPAEWEKYGKSAGYIRNKQMLDEGKPDIVVAFPGGPGTRNMIKQAREYNVKVIEVQDDREQK